MEFMQKAIDLAKNSGADVPVGAIVVKDGKIISSACNERELTNDVTAHAEIVAIRKACEKLGNWRLDGCDLYVTLEPCPMCAWAIIQSRISTVYFGAFDAICGAFGSALDLRNVSNSDINIYSGILEEECYNIIKEFWNEVRNKRDN